MARPHSLECRTMCMTLPYFFWARASLNRASVVSTWMMMGWVSQAKHQSWSLATHIANTGFSKVRIVPVSSDGKAALDVA